VCIQSSRLYVGVDSRSPTSGGSGLPKGRQGGEAELGGRTCVSCVSYALCRAMEGWKDVWACRCMGEYPRSLECVRVDQWIYPCGSLRIGLSSSIYTYLYLSLSVLCIYFTDDAFLSSQTQTHTHKSFHARHNTLTHVHTIVHIPINAPHTSHHSAVV
jgi:hypothetical protein